MKVSHFAKVIDHNNKTRFEFPAGTLFDKINDEWTQIIEYYENYFPFAVGKNDGNYRPVTREEFSNNNFINLLVACCRDKRIKKLCNDNVRVCIDGYPLCISNEFQIYLSKYDRIFMFWDYSTFRGVIDFNKIKIHRNQIKPEIYEYDDAPLLVMSDLFFD